MTKQEAVDACRLEMRVGGSPVKATIDLTRILTLEGLSMPVHVTSETLLNLEERLVRVERILQKATERQQQKAKATP